MGATFFQTLSFGKTAGEAFAASRQEALYRHGHDGYTGSIAEKGEFTELTLPARVTPEKVIEWAEYAEEYDRHVDEASWNYKAGREREMKASQKLAAAAERKIPKKHRDLAWKASEIMNDKWGPALCLKVSGKASQELRERWGYKGKRGNFYVFAGWASS